MCKLVSIITGTYNRHNTLLKCIDNVSAQTYENIEHCIVSDGPDEYLRELHLCGWDGRNKYPIKFVETGRQWSQFLANSISAVPFQVAQWLASGEYIMWLADDEEITPDHVELLVNLLEEKDVDFVYSMSEIWFNPSLGRVLMPQAIGDVLPKNGNITHALFRAELLDYRGFMTHVGSGTDIDQIATWISSGASWAFLPKVTHVHRVDKFGDGEIQKEPQPLRGVVNKCNQVKDYVGQVVDNKTIVEIIDNDSIVIGSSYRKDLTTQYVVLMCVCGRQFVATLHALFTGKIPQCIHKMERDYERETESVST